MRLYLYIFSRLAPSRPVGYDEAAGFVVRARSSSAARKLVAATPSYENGPGAEGADVWRDPRHSRCRKLGEVTPGAAYAEGIVMRDFKAG